VLCSDGVETAGVSVEEMGGCCSRTAISTAGGAGDRAVPGAGAPDNVTLAVARVEVDVTKTAVLPRLKL